MIYYKDTRWDKIDKKQLVRAIIQLVSFLLIPGLFISVFSAIGSVVSALVSGTFVIAQQAGNIALVLAVFAITALWGRFFCGYICSFGAMQDLIWRAGKRIFKKPVVTEKTDSLLKKLKYAVLVFVIVFVWIFPVLGSTIWSPWTVFGMFSSIGSFPPASYLLSVGGLLLLLTILGSLVIERFFCRYLCPLGALFSLASRFRLFRVKKPATACGSCRLCTRACSMGIAMYKYDSISSGECIDCMKCVSACKRSNVSAKPLPAVSGTMAAMMLAGFAYAGTDPILPSDIILSGNTSVQSEEQAASSVPSVTETKKPEDVQEIQQGKYTDGVYSGSGQGYKGTIKVTVTVSGGMITEIDVDSYSDDRQFFSKAQNGIISEVIAAQDINVSTVSGATFSSNGILAAIADALDISYTNPNSSNTRRH